MTVPSRAYVSIQWLRAVAALMVVGFHLRVQLARGGSSIDMPEWLSGGVDIFFVVSGFIMWATTVDRPMTPLEFYRKRIDRIVPLYWLLTALTAVGLLIAPRLFQSAAFDPPHVLASFLFIPWPHPVLGGLEPVLVPGWTLNYEMFFYLLFGAALLLPPARRLPAMGAALLGLAVLGAFAAPGGALAFYGASLVLEFAFGMVIGRLVVGRAPPARAARWLGLAAVIAGFVALATLSDLAPGAWRGLSYGVPAALIVGGAVLVETSGALPLRFAALHRLGDASYALYLTHGVVLSAVGQFWRKLVPLHGVAADAMFCIAATGLACIVGLTVHSVVERPMGNAIAAARAQSRAIPRRAAA